MARSSPACRQPPIRLTTCAGFRRPRSRWHRDQRWSNIVRKALTDLLGKTPHGLMLRRTWEDGPGSGDI
jgi:hypothetical protein